MSTTEMVAPVSFTERAAAELKRLQEQPDFDPEKAVVVRA